MDGAGPRFPAPGNAWVGEARPRPGGARRANRLWRPNSPDRGSSSPDGRARGAELGLDLGPGPATGNLRPPPGPARPGPADTRAYRPGPWPRAHLSPGTPACWRSPGPGLETPHPGDGLGGGSRAPRRRETAFPFRPRENSRPAAQAGPRPGPLATGRSATKPCNAGLGALSRAAVRGLGRAGQRSRGWPPGGGTSRLAGPRDPGRGHPHRAPRGRGATTGCPTPVSGNMKRRGGVGGREPLGYGGDLPPAERPGWTPGADTERGHQGRARGRLAATGPRT